MATRRTNVLALPALGALLLLLVGCGSQGGGQEARKAVRSAAVKTSHVRSYRVTTSTTLDVTKSRSVTVKGEGAFAPPRKRGKLALDMTQLSELIGRPVGTAQIVVAGTDAYLRIPILKAIQPKLKPWVKVDLQEAGRSSGVDFTSFLQFGQGGDPTQTLQYLRATGSVKKVADEQIRGIQTTHYRGDIELRKVAKLVPKADRARTQVAIGRLIFLTRQNKLPIDVWIDGTNKIRRLTFRENVRIGNRPTPLRLSMDLFDFGTPVVAPVPATKDVTDLTKLVRKTKR